MGKLKFNAIVGQSGGPTSAINATLSGVVRMASKSGKIDTLYGMKNGIFGFLNEDLKSLNFLFDNEKELSCLERTPGCALGSCRYKLPDDLKSEIYRKIFDLFDKYNIGYFFYIGGNDSMDTVAKLSLYNKENSRGVSIIGLPKTVDNDLVLTDHTPGYGSACKYIATSVYEIALDIMAYRMPSVTVVETMGRDTGWLNCASSLSKYCCGVGADLIYLPETDFSCEKFLREVEDKLTLQKGVLVSVSEGIDIQGKDLNSTISRSDAFNHKSLSGVGKILENQIKENLGCKVRSMELNLPQRCAMHIASKRDINESVSVGQFGVKAATCGYTGKMVSIMRKQGEYGIELGLVDAGLVANRVKKVPLDFINKEQNYLTKKCVDYVSPLIEGEVNIDYVGGLPRYFKLR